jgi:hypothetical protein
LDAQAPGSVKQVFGGLVGGSARCSHPNTDTALTIFATTISCSPSITHPEKAPNFRVAFLKLCDFNKTN